MIADRRKQFKQHWTLEHMAPAGTWQIGVDAPPKSRAGAENSACNASEHGVR
jgi:hypothetical protein